MWLPPSVTEQQHRERLEYEQQLRAQVVRDHMLKVKGILDEFNYELRRIDPKLEMVRAGASAENTALRAGYYHIIRWNDGAPPQVIVIEGEHGEFAEPTSRVFEMLARQDLWDPGNMRLLRQRQRLLDDAAERKKIREREARQEEAWERWQSATRAQVSMNRDTPWAQNAAGYNRTKGIKKKAA